MLLIDGDWLCFNTAIAFQYKNPFSDELEYDEHLSIRTLERRIFYFKERLNCDDVYFLFSCDRENNFRREIDNSYKMNREGLEKPIGLKSLIKFTENNYPFLYENRLEADDLISILATGTYKSNHIIVSVDKDFLTIPKATIYNPNLDILKKQTQTEALKAFIYQIIVGDMSDGYKGLKGIGDVKARKFIKKIFKTCNNFTEIWFELIRLAWKQGHTEAYLLSQARLAYLLRNKNYDFDTKKIRYWRPAY